MSEYGKPKLEFREHPGVLFAWDSPNDHLRMQIGNWLAKRPEINAPSLPAVGRRGKFVEVDEGSSAQDLRGAYRAGVQRRANAQRERDGHLAEDAKRLLAGENPEFRMPQERVACKDPGGRHLEEGNGMPVLSGVRNYDRFQIDQAARGPNGLQAEIRLLLEGRGIPLDTIDMNVFDGEYGRGITVANLAEELINLEPAESPMRKAWRNNHLFLSATDPVSFCATIESLSLQALSRLPTKQSASLTPPGAAK